jgi:hypothetical protein
MRYVFYPVSIHAVCVLFYKYSCGVLFYKFFTVVVILIHNYSTKFLFSLSHVSGHRNKVELKKWDPGPD